MGEFKTSGLGYICPHFEVKASLAAVSDGKTQTGVDVNGKTDDIIALYVLITSKVVKVLRDSCKETDEKKKEDIIDETIARLVSTGLVLAEAEEKSANE